MKGCTAPPRQQYRPPHVQNSWMPGNWFAGNNGSPNFIGQPSSMPYAPRFPYDSGYAQPRYSVPSVYHTPRPNAGYVPSRRTFEKPSSRVACDSRSQPSSSPQQEAPSSPPSPPKQDPKVVSVQQFTILKKDKHEEEPQPVPAQDTVVTGDSSDTIVRSSPVETRESVFIEKGKTPMCVINELARHHKVLHQYHLTDESGPAHAKTFTVTLRLGMKPDGSEDDVEEYVAKGNSIKKAQQTAARMALENTKLSRPSPKSPKAPVRLMPSVELNALAMKLGLKIQFTFDALPVQVLNGYRRTSCRVTLTVGGKEYIGTGVTIQGAKHNAASKALEEFLKLGVSKDSSSAAAALPFAREASVDFPSPYAVKLTPEQEEERQKFEKLLDSKSPISFLYELGIRHDFNVDFAVIQETGPPHLRVFSTRCIVTPVVHDRAEAISPKPGKPKASLLTVPMVVEAEGAGKKLSKKNVAEKVLQELMKLSPELVQPSAKKEVPFNAKRDGKGGKQQAKKRKPKISKEKAGSVDYGDGINPISRLIQIQQAKKEKEPIYTLLLEKSLQRRKEFTVQATCGEFTCEGVGNNKKMAKRAAAEALLVAMGYNKPMPVPDKPAIKQKTGSEEELGEDAEEKKRPVGRKVTFGANTKESNDNAPRGAAALAAARGRQQMAAATLNFMSSPSMTSIVTQEPVSMPKVQTRSSGNQEPVSLPKAQTRSIVNQESVSMLKAQIHRSKMELEYISQVEGFPVDFASYPKKSGDRDEFFCLVTFPTWKVPLDGQSIPNGVFHGIAPTAEEAQEIASRQALDTLAKVGLSTVLAKVEISR